jgi:CRP-like cAMP-binding protein
VSEPTANEKRQPFEGHALFESLSQEDLDALLVHARVEQYPTGRQIFSKGSPGRSLMAILRGSVRVSAPSDAGRKIVLTILRAGEVLGEIALLDGGERTADATAITDCELLVLDHRDFISFLERRAHLCISLLKVLCQRLRQTDQQVEDTVFKRLDKRVAKALISLVNSAPRGEEVGRIGSLRISQEELASMVGATRESVNKQLHVWEKAGLVRLEKRLIVVSDVAAIQALV